MVREIAQHIGGENKYPNVLTSILRIGYEEGPSGYFSGLIPNLLSGYVTILAMAGIRYGAERLIKHVVSFITIILFNHFFKGRTYRPN